MRLPGRAPHVALFSIVSVAAVFFASRWSPAQPPTEVAVPSPAVAASAMPAAPSVAAVIAPAAGAPASAAASTSGAASAPGAEPRALAVAAPLPAIGGRSDGPRSAAVDFGDRARKRVALTFDAGADAGYTASILDTLARERVVAAFGITGVWAEENPALVKRMAAEGHQLINHTWDHRSFTGLSTGAGALTREQRWAQIDRTEAAVQRIAGVSTLPYFRPPYGDSDASVLADVGARGYTITAMWAVDSLGWNGLSAPRIVERTLRLASPGAILIFHVGSQSQDGPALPEIIAGLKAQGYEFTTVAGLLP